MIVYQKFNISDFSDCLMVTDGHVGELYGIKGDNVYYLPRGEAAKNFENVANLAVGFCLASLNAADGLSPSAAAASEIPWVLPQAFTSAESL